MNSKTIFYTIAVIGGIFCGLLEYYSRSKIKYKDDSLWSKVITWEIYLLVVIGIYSLFMLIYGFFESLLND